MTDKVGDLEQQIRTQRDLDNPPLHLWHPPLSGDIPIVIRADGSWYHDGGLIKRDSIVRLFASILRREEDGHYYLVTPAEKWRLQVEAHALIVTDIEHRGSGDQLVATLNTGREVAVTAAHPLFLDCDRDGVAALQLDHGLTALFSRAAWYRLADLAEAEGERMVVRSGGEVFELTA